MRKDGNGKQKKENVQQQREGEREREGDRERENIERHRT